MKFLKKIFHKKKRKNQEEKHESWYNNSHEILDKGVGEIPVDTGALTSSSMYMESSKQLSH